MTHRLLNLLTLIHDQVEEPASTKTLLDTTADCLHFVTEFFEVISQSVPHIHHSALQLAPQLSIVKKLYSQQLSSPVARVVTGVPASWDSCTATAGMINDWRVNCIAWSPCGQFVASASWNRIQVQDSNTLERVYILKHPGSVSYRSPIFLTFSPDGCLLACAYK